MNIEGLDYNTQREKLVLPEYGREVQKMVDYAISLPTKEERQLCAEVIIDIMAKMAPQNRESSNYKQKLWDHLAIMSGFNNIAATWCGSCYAQNVRILRNEWGFRGTMVTDWSNGDDNMYPERGIRAGNDIWLNPNAANARPLNMSNPTTVYCAKIAARNVI